MATRPPAVHPEPVPKQALLKHQSPEERLDANGLHVATLKNRPVVDFLEIDGDGKTVALFSGMVMFSAPLTSKGVATLHHKLDAWEADRGHTPGAAAKTIEEQKHPRTHDR